MATSLFIEVRYPRLECLLGIQRSELPWDSRLN
ncbi:hypothetical protein YPPY29_4109, partial [Yersinia pestis PY-29]